MLNDLKYFEAPILFHAIVHAQKIPKFAAFMLLFSQQSYLKSRQTDNFITGKNLLRLQDATQSWPLA